MKDSSIDNLRHSCAHLLAAAVMELYPQALRTIGPAIDKGFYYDFDDLKISEADLPAIEAKMHELSKTWDRFEGREVSPEEAKKIYKDNPYKLDLIEEFAGQKLTIYKSGDYEDLCRGGHIDHPDKQLKHFKLLSIAGAYWRSNEKNKMLTRIYGTAFPTQEELDKYLWQQEEAKKRDHRKIGAQLGLWTFSDYVGGGLPLFTPKGTIVRRLINEYVEELQNKQGINQVWTPQIAKAELFKISGHYEKYRENLFSIRSNYSDEEFFLKPMNCPQHTQIYASQPRSYRDLPIRMADFAMLYRDEKPGELIGLTRTRSFSQDDCHIFCREDQITAEMNMALDMTKTIMETYGFKYKYRLSLHDPDHPEKYLGDPQTWAKAEKLSEAVLKDRGMEYFPGVGEAAFYAPKLDLIATDSLGREWQLSTLQIDFFMPQRFNLTYIDEKGRKQTPVMLHRAISGSPERLMAILIEHFAGAFPTWLSPVHVVILPISDKHLDYAKKVESGLKSQNIRVELNDKNEPLNARIRDTQLQKVPYMLIVGDREVESNTVARRGRSGKDYGPQSLNEFIKDLRHEIDNRLNV
ncbi:threonine--tRNA ligase [Candidatus Amesbacteria bacterium RIFCSPHIGHO2_02_FULL_47_9]|nr:MAG: threonine--tRNA ligase [Candidatus Amesbacteria bacterium RIFCSPHIGHO2_02_FULL_47_9]OGD07331.1 MAG: threonine--tRNA ligase [Candidatus Amesbacteria bacterium RIFCSPLOWO2_01_FULL_49_25]